MSLTFRCVTAFCKAMTSIMAWLRFDTIVDVDKLLIQLVT